MSTLSEPTLYSIKAILIMDNDGNRLISKYYDDAFSTIREQKIFEKNLFNKTHRANAEIVMFEGLTCVYRSSVDLLFYVVGSASENEILLMNVLNCLFDSVSQMLRKGVEKKALLDKLDSVLLAIDELCDGGVLLEIDTATIVSRAAVKSDDIPLGDQTVAQVLNIAKEQISWSLLK